MPAYVVLVRPQLAENIGSVARAMGNFGFDKLRIISPQVDVLDAKAIAMAAGNHLVLENAEIFSTFEESIADCHEVYATSAVVRQMVKPITTPEHMNKNRSCKTALVFGPERTGLCNDEISLCTGLMTIPVHPDFSSLNLGQACVIVLYEWYKSIQNQPDYLNTGESALCCIEKKLYFLNKLEEILDDLNFWRVPSKKEHMKRNIQNTFIRHPYTEQEIQTLIGVVQDYKKKNI